MSVIISVKFRCKLLSETGCKLLRSRLLVPKNLTAAILVRVFSWMTFPRCHVQKIFFPWQLVSTSANIDIGTGPRVLPVIGTPAKGLLKKILNKCVTIYSNVYNNMQLINGLAVPWVVIGTTKGILARVRSTSANIPLGVPITTQGTARPFNDLFIVCLLLESKLK